MRRTVYVHIKRVVAEISPDNKRMIGIMQDRGFELDMQIQNGVVLGNKTLTD